MISSGGEARECRVREKVLWLGSHTGWENCLLTGSGAGDFLVGLGEGGRGV